MDYPELVAVEWVDTTNIPEWTPVDEIKGWAADGGFVCRSIGYLIYEDDECIVLAARVALQAEPPQVGLYERIPKGVISKRWTVHLPETYRAGA